MELIIDDLDPGNEGPSTYSNVNDKTLTESPRRLSQLPHLCETPGPNPWLSEDRGKKGVVFM